MKYYSSLIFFGINLFTIFHILIFGSCKKENSSNSSIQSPFKVKYEITTSAPLSTSIGTGLSVHFSNSSGTLTESLYNKSVPWTKEENIIETKRPFQIDLNTDGIVLTDPGSITGNIYINGVKKASFTVVTSQKSSIGGYNIATLNGQYTVK